MTNQPRNSTYASLKLVCMLALAGLTGIMFGACRDDDGDDGVDFFAEQDCRDYCERAVECDDDRNEEDCVESCIDRMGSCQADEQEAALEQLQDCADESCDDFLACTIDVGATCYFGL